MMAGHDVPEDRYYTRTHEWVKLEDGKAKIGLTSYAVEELGDITYVEIRPIGTSVNQGDEIGFVESSKTTEKIYSPVSGVISEVNEEVGVVTEGSEEIPMGLEAISEDPYGKGWLAILEVRDDVKEETKNLLSSDEYRKLLEEHH